MTISTEDLGIKAEIIDVKTKKEQTKKGNEKGETKKGNGGGADDIAPAFSEEHIALEFANMHADELRYVAQWGQWFIWDGTCWRSDKERKVFTMARKLCRTFGVACNDTEKVRRGISSAKTRAAVVSLAGEDQRLAANIEQWDADPWLLNTPDGVVDLRNGELRAHQLTDYMTKQAAVSPGGDCPLWLSFMDKITAGNIELQSYLQRVSGYCLTGVTHEQELFFNYGEGNNGKGRFTGAIAGILDDYHETAAIETFTVTKNEQHPTDLAGLIGARLVTANETEEGRRWAEARVKQLTGEDPVRARFMRQDFFTYKPQFKLMFNGNHMPALRTINKAITRRFNRIPFLVVIADEEIDKQLDKKLQKEWPGILKWMIEGCLQWQKLGGLNPPALVTEATDSYLENEDILGEWLNECCELNKGAWSSSTDLFTSWKYWAAEREEWVGAVKTFSQRLEDRGGFKPCKNPEKTKRGFKGLRLKEGQKKDPVHRIVATPVEQPTEEERQHGKRARF